MIWAAVSIYHEPSALVLLSEFVCMLLSSSSSSRNRLALAVLVALLPEHSHLNIPFGCNHILPHNIYTHYSTLIPIMPEEGMMNTLAMEPQARWIVTHPTLIGS